MMDGFMPGSETRLQGSGRGPTAPPADLRVDSSARARLIGTIATVVAAVVLVAVAAGNVNGAHGYQWDFGVVPQYLPALLRGLVLTVELTVICMATGLALGIAVAAARMSKVALLRWLTAVYIDIMRSTPLLIQLVWIFYALPILLGVRLDGLPAAIIALTLHMGAYYGEAFRAGIQAIPHTQIEAAEILGLRRGQRLRYVILPQAARNVLPVLVTYGVLLVKDTSLVSVIGMNDLMNVGSNIALTTFRPLELLTTVGVMYFALVLPATALTSRLEKWLSRHLVKR